MPEIPGGYQRLEKSERHAAFGARRVGPANPAETLTVSIRVRRRPDAPPLPDPAALAATPLGQRQYLSREEFAARYGADPKDLEQVADFARSHGLKVIETSVPRRMVVVSGTVAQMNSTFAVDLGNYQSPTQSYRGREGYVSVPSNLADIVEGVFGLDNRQMAQPLIVQASAPTGGAQTTVTLTPPIVAGLYGFPTSPNAAGQTIGLLEFGGGYLTTDIESYFSSLQLTAPTLVSVSVDGATNSPGTSGSDEVTLDIDVAGSVAQGARIAVYFAPWTQQGWVDIVTTAIHDATNKPSVLSISWGWPEFETISGLTWSNAAINAVSETFQDAVALGVTIFAASGDSGSSCGIEDAKAHVLYPASDPGVTACGGTTISNVSGSSFTQSTWTPTGGGVSDFFPLPYWQTWANVPVSVNDGHKGRGIPDVAGNADPNSGYLLVLDGVTSVGFGGTSAVAPMYAGLVALLEAALGEPLGYLNPNIYAFSGPYVYTDVNDGASNASGGALGYASGPGWDACTGFGSIVGNALEAALTGVGLPPAMAVFNGSLYVAYKSVEFDDRIFSTSFNGTAWTPPRQVSTVGTSSGASLAVFNGKLYMAWKGMQADQAIYWSVFDGSSWAAQQQAPGFGTSTGPSLAVFNNALYMAWKGIQGDQRVFWSSFNGAWANQQVVPGIGASVGPSLAVFNGRLYMAWKGEFGDQRLFYSNFDGTIWTSQQLIPGTSSEGASLAVFDNALYAAWKGVVGDQNISWSRFNGSVWTPPQSLAGGATSVGPSLAAFNSLLYMVWKALSGDEDISYSSFNGTAWVAQQQIPGAGTSPDLAKKNNASRA
jgi:Pro-kumamolisin, activation domain